MQHIRKENLLGDYESTTNQKTARFIINHSDDRRVRILTVRAQDEITVAVDCWSYCYHMDILR
jgi:hypothetical protein